MSFPSLGWPSKDHRDYQTIGLLSAWRARRSRPGGWPPPPGDRPRGTGVPVLSAIVRVRRDDAVLHVELRSPSEQRAPVAARDGAGGRARTWTFVLPLN